MISVIINTCALGDPKAVNSQGRVRHAQRAFALRNFLIPFYAANASELIVVGEWEPGDGYKYVEVPSVYKTCVDALAQRQAGFEVSTGDTLVFQHDDHILAADWWLHLDSRVDVLSPARYARVECGSPVRLNNGEAGALNPAPYLSGHCSVFKRAVLEACPWGNVPPVHTWDCALTAQIRAAGFHLAHSDQMRVWDVEG